MGAAFYQPRILIWDLENMANRGWFFGAPYDANIAEIDHRSHLLMIGWKWYGEKQTNIAKLSDYKGYSKDKCNDKPLAELGRELLNEADIVVAHNGNSFDQKVMMAAIMRHRIPPPMPFQQVDTKSDVKRVAKFDSNKLDHLSDEFGIGRKKQHIGFPLWLGVEAGDPKMWKMMSDYCKQDVKLLEELYTVVRPYIKNHPAMNVMMQKPDACKTCGGTSLRSGGKHHSTKVGRYEYFYCRNCGTPHKSRIPEPQTKEQKVKYV